jgi:hypothetical protein
MTNKWKKKEVTKGKNIEKSFHACIYFVKYNHTSQLNLLNVYIDVLDCANSVTSIRIL